jgi:hypothetical protein
MATGVTAITLVGFLPEIHSFPLLFGVFPLADLPASELYVSGLLMVASA